LHAADVVQTLHSLLQMGGIEFARSPLEVFSLLIAACVHDIGHCGLNNDFQINSRSDIALFYNDISPLENMHASKAVMLLLGKKSYEPEGSLLSSFSTEQISSIRKIVVDAVLYTDMSKHSSHLNYLNTTLLNECRQIKDCLGRVKKSDSAMQVLSFLLHLSDISGAAKPAPLFQKWADLVFEEFFSQGDIEKSLGMDISPLCDRHSVDLPKSQIGYISYVILPSFVVLLILLLNITINRCLIFIAFFFLVLIK